MRIFRLTLPLFLLMACSPGAEDRAGPITVEVIAGEDGYQLLRGGAPYVIKGAGLEFGDVTSLAAHGGNSIRNWTTSNGMESAGEVLDKALANGVSVALCLPMQAERWGFDYNDSEAVAAQLEKFREEVVAYRNHPALLAWIIGNELNFDYTNPKVYDAVNDVSKMIHELDPHHPTTTTVAGLGENVVRDIDARAPDLDFVSFQVYGELFILRDFIRRIGYDKPFFVTEWGAVGHWEVGKTRWGAPIEATSSEKAATYLRGYRDVLHPLDSLLIGSYAFLWGQKQERTPTWFGMFTENGEETETVDVMHYIWNGSWPANRSPRVNGVTLDGKAANQNVTVQAGQSYDIDADIVDHENDVLTYRWEVKPESDTREVGGDFEDSIESLDGLIEDTASARTNLRAPQTSGAYRLFVYAYDGNGHAAHANIPFLVTPRDGT